MYDFKYHRPQALAQAIDLIGRNEEAKLLASCMSLIVNFKFRPACCSDLVDLKGIQDLQGVTVVDGTFVVGATTRHADVAVDEDVKRTIPALAVLAGGIGDPLVRKQGTIGGSIANADPGADYPAAVLGLGATITTDQRDIAGGDFFQGLFDTALEEDKIIHALRFPSPQRAGYAKLANSATCFAVVGVFAEPPTGVRVAVTAAGLAPFRLPAAEAALALDFAPAALDGPEVSVEGLTSGIHASAEYRAHTIIAMAKRGRGGDQAPDRLIAHRGT
jgi:aerobic carbon-monoxide dehydrogenase medium subunit